MHTYTFRILLIVALTSGVMLGFIPMAGAQERCLPFSGTQYGWYDAGWFSVGDFTLGRDIFPAKIAVVNTSFSDDGPVWRGTETWTFDFGKGNTIQLKTAFATEHMTDAVSTSGVFHLNEVGTFTNGKGIFKKAYGHLSSQGPFGPSVKLPDSVKPPAAAQSFWVSASQGIVCGALLPTI